VSAAGTDGPAGFAVGLCTVTFRSLDPAAVVDRAVGAGVEVLEWGGDVHVPEGDLDAARWAAHLSAAAGLGVAAYGSYLYLDEHLDRRLGPVLDTTVALGAPAVRVWCPDLTDEGAGWSALVDAAARAVTAADAAGVVVYLEFHGGTATAEVSDVVRLLDAVPGLRTGWQPPYWAPRSLAEELADVRRLADRLLHVDVYAWTPDGLRHPLSVEHDAWAARFGAAWAATGAARDVGLRPAALVEFVPDDDPEVLEREVASLRRALGRRPGPLSASGR